jgi:hypothetical protein
MAAPQTDDSGFFGNIGKRLTGAAQAMANATGLEPVVPPGVAPEAVGETTTGGRRYRKTRKGKRSTRRTTRRKGARKAKKSRKH